MIKYIMWYLFYHVLSLTQVSVFYVFNMEKGLWVGALHLETDGTKHITWQMHHH